MSKPLRADARRNRARLLEVAEAVFAEQGTSASTEEIARRAGVGIGTVFRHFPTKGELLEAVFHGRLDRMIAEAEALATGDDPGAAFFAFFTKVVDEAATKDAYIEALTAAGVDVDNALSEVGNILKAAMGTLLRGAQSAGVVRPDIGIQELLALLIGASQASRSAGWDPAVSARTLEIVFDGLRSRPAQVRGRRPTS